MGHAVKGHPRLTGHGGEFWQNVVHWKGEWQTTPVLLPPEPHEQYEKAKRYDTRRWAPRSEGVPCATREEQRAISNSSRKNEEDSPNMKWDSIVDVFGGESKAQCCEDQYCIGTWNVRSAKQGKLNVVKEEMASVNINILGTSELKCEWEWVNLIQMTIISTTVGKNPLEEME